MSHRKASNSANLLNLIPSDLFSDIEQCHSEQVLGGTGVTIATPSPKSGNDDPTGNESLVIATDSTKLSVSMDNTTQSFFVYRLESNNEFASIIVTN